jgi:small-conductance mechanosensitive channel
MDIVLWGNPVRQWLLAGAAAVAVLGGLYLTRRVLVARLAAVASRTSNPFDDVLIKMIGSTQAFFLAMAAAWVGGSLLSVSASAHAVLRIIAIVAVAIQVAIWGSTVIAGALGVRVRRVQAKDPAGATTLTALSLVARLALYALLVLLTLDNLGVNVSALLAGLGIGGVAIALAIQNILGDLFASLSIVLDKPFVVGDFIVVGDLMGSVEHVGLKTTRVRSLSGEQLIFANADLLGSRIRNFKRMAERRVVFSIGVTYQTPHARLASIPGLIREIICGEPGARFDRAHFKSYDDSALMFEVVYFVLDPDYNRFMDIQQRINFALFRRFELEGIEFAYPTRTVYVRPELAGPAAQAA